MKKIIKYSIALIFGVIFITSCDEKAFLEEEPLDFYSPK